MSNRLVVFKILISYIFFKIHINKTVWEEIHNEQSRTNSTIKGNVEFRKI